MVTGRLESILADKNEKEKYNLHRQKPIQSPEL